MPPLAPWVSPSPRLAAALAPVREHRWLRHSAIALAYFAAGHAALAAATEHRAVSSLWPPAGLALFALMRYGVGVWPGIAVAAFALNVSNGLSLLGSLTIAAGDVVEPLVGAWMLRRVWGERLAPRGVSDVLALAGLGGGLATMLGATIGVATLVITGATRLSAAVGLWLVWWTGDAVGVVVVAPLLFAWADAALLRTIWRALAARAPSAREWLRGWHARPWRDVVEQVALAVLTVAIFLELRTLAFAVFPLAGWIALRQGMRGATMATLIVAVLAAWHTLAGTGPFTQSSPTSNLFALQLYVSVLGVMNLLFAAMQMEAEEGRARLAGLSHQLLTAHEDERRRVAREVHDELGQSLTAAKVGLAAALQRTRLRGSLDSERHVRGAAATLDRAIESVQRIVLALRPGVLDSLGPVAAIEYAAQQFAMQTGIPVQLDLPEESPDLDTASATTLYRVTQETLTNVARHAAAQRVWLRLTFSPHAVELRVVDDGRGIGDETLRQPRSMGILGMRERAAALGGRLTVSRAPVQGTVVQLWLPRAPLINPDAERRPA